LKLISKRIFFRLGPVNPVSCSIPIQKTKPQQATFNVGTPPKASFSFKSSSSSFNQQIFYSPQKSSQSSLSPASNSNVSFGSSLQDRRTMQAPLPQPSLSFNFRQGSNASLVNASSGNALAGTSSSAESLISDMVKEAMTSNPMMQSVYGSLNSTPPKKTNEYEMPLIGRVSCFIILLINFQ